MSERIGAPPSPDPLDVIPAAEPLPPTKPKRARKSTATDLSAPAPVLRRSNRHSTETSTPGPSSVKLEPEADEPPKKKRGRPSKAALPTAPKEEEVKVKEEIAGVHQTQHVTLPPPISAGPSYSSTEVKPNIDHLYANYNPPGSEMYSSAQASSSLQAVSVPPVPNALAASAPSPAKRPRKSAADKAKEKAEKPEKRAFKIRAKAPQATMQRAQRVMTQRMYMINREKYPGTILAEQFKVLGSTGNVYTIKIESTPSCNCPDFLKGNAPCKHIIFVFLKVLKVPSDSPLWYQKSFIASQILPCRLKTHGQLSELEEIFTSAPSSPTENSVSVHVRNAYLKAMGLGGDEEAEKAEEEAAKEAEEAAAQAAKDGRKWTFGDDCPVCYDEMTEDDEKKGKLVFDEAMGGCGKPLHAQCFKMWAATAKAKGDDVTCVWCRTPWPTADAAGAGKGKGKAAGGLDYSSLGYLNMADIAGMSRQRDISSYYTGPIAGRRYEDRYADD